MKTTLVILLAALTAIPAAQAQRPDDVSRPATWLLFAGVGTWYGTRAWSRRSSTRRPARIMPAGELVGTGAAAGSHG